MGETLGEVVGYTISEAAGEVCRKVGDVGGTVHSVEHQARVMNEAQARVVNEAQD